MKKHILFLLIVLSTTAYSQDANRRAIKNNGLPVSETVFVTTNATTLVTGETLHTKLYCLDPNSHTGSLISKIAYLELVGSDKKVISRQKLLLQNGTAGADIFIPTTLQTGNYKLIAYTRWMLGESLRDFYETDIIVINPFTAIKMVGMAAEKPIAPDTLPTAASPSISIKSHKKIYTIREKVVLDITAPPGSYSVSIRKTDGHFQKKQTSPREFLDSITQKNPNQSRLANNALLPELRGELLSGKIVSKTASNLKDKTVALTIKGQTFAFKLVKTNAAGEFSFILDSEPIRADVMVQLMEENRADYTIVLEEPKETDLSALQFPTELPVMLLDRETITQRSVANQIENAYYSSKKDSLKAAPKTPTFYNSAEKQYVLDDYTRFPTIRETITEIIQEAGYQKTKKGYRVFIRNYYAETAAYGPPLVLLDGFPIQDMNALFDYPASGIYKIGIINVPYIYGPKTFSGVISFFTKNNDFEPNTNAGFIKKATVLRPQPDKIYFSPDYSIGNKNSRIPDYRYQLLWIPEWNAETKKCTFFTSDITGNFEITVEGFTQNGEPIFIRDFIEVK